MTGHEATVQDKRRIGDVDVPVRVTPWGLIAIITPEIARQLLVQNTRNRSIRRTRVDFYGRDMGRWALNGETLIFDRDGVLLDGQHRLRACVESGETFETYIIGDIDPSARDTIGSGLTRTYGDVLGFEGEADGRNLAAALTTAWLLDTNHHLWHGANIPHPTRADLTAYLAEHPDIRESLNVGSRASKSPVHYRQSLAAALHHLMARVDGPAADDFWEGIITGEALTATDPVFRLRAVLLGYASHRKPSSAHTAALTIKAWEAFRKGTPVKQLGWRRTGDNPEPFPLIKGLGWGVQP